MPALQILELGASQLVFLNTLRNVSTYLGMCRLTASDFSDSWAQTPPYLYGYAPLTKPRVPHFLRRSKLTIKTHENIAELSQTGKWSNCERQEEF